MGQRCRSQGSDGRDESRRAWGPRREAYCRREPKDGARAGRRTVDYGNNVTKMPIARTPPKTRIASTSERIFASFKKRNYASISHQGMTAGITHFI
jgi:hypothetical protein